MHVDVNGARLHVREAGPASDNVLLLVHGFPLHSGMWAPQLDDPPPGWRVLAPDIRGFGDSGDVGGAVLSMDVCARDLATMLQQLGVTQAVVCGLSMGGYIAFSMLRRHAPLIRGLVLCDTRAEQDSQDARTARHTLAERVLRDGIEPLVDSMLPRMLAPRNRDRMVALRIRDIMQSVTAPAAAAALLGMAERVDNTDLLRNITIPTQVVVGSDDAITPVGPARLMSRAIPGSYMDVIPDSGHLPNVEEPEIFNAVLRRFLSAL